jgi:hypothetical protein
MTQLIHNTDPDHRFKIIMCNEWAVGHSLEVVKSIYVPL